MKITERSQHVPDGLKTQDMCNKAVEVEGGMFRNVPDKFKTQEMCDKAIMKDGSMLRFVPDNFIKDFMFQRFLRFKGRNKPYGVEVVNNIIERLRLRKVFYVEIRDELAPIAWHPDRVFDWCFDEEEKKDLMRLWGSAEL